MLLLAIYSILVVIWSGLSIIEIGGSVRSKNGAGRLLEIGWLDFAGLLHLNCQNPNSGCGRAHGLVETTFQPRRVLHPLPVAVAG